MELQELISRARFLFEGADKRKIVFDLINGKRSSKEIAKKTGRSLSATLQDLQKMKDFGLINLMINEKGKVKKKNKSVIYEKNLILKHIAESYFKGYTKLSTSNKTFTTKSSSTKRINHGITVPNENEILDICKSGEDQIYEFKGIGVEMKVLSKEIAAFANTKLGGLIFYGVEDDGTISGSDKSRQSFDQSLQNSVRNLVSPALSITILEKLVLNYKIILIRIPPWNKREVYQYDGRVYIRKGTNMFAAKHEESRRLYQGEYII